MNKQLKTIIASAFISSSIVSLAFASDLEQIRFANGNETIVIDDTKYDLIEEDKSYGMTIYKVKYDGGEPMVLPSSDNPNSREGGFPEGNARPAALRIMINMKNNVAALIPELKSKSKDEADFYEYQLPVGSKIKCYSTSDTVLNMLEAEGNEEISFFKTRNSEIAKRVCGENIIGLTREEIYKKYGEQSDNQTPHIFYGFTAGDTYEISCNIYLKDDVVTEVAFGNLESWGRYSGYKTSKKEYDFLFTQAICTGDGVRVRKSPVTGEPITKLNKYDDFYIKDFSKSEDGKSVWVNILTANGIDGWMHSDYVSLDKKSPSLNTQMVSTINYHHWVNEKYYDEEAQMVTIKDPNVYVLGLKIGDDVKAIEKVSEALKESLWDFEGNGTIESDGFNEWNDHYGKGTLDIVTSNGFIKAFVIRIY